MIGISTSIARLGVYLTRHGLLATFRRSGLAVRRALSSNRCVVFCCDLPLEKSWRVKLPNALNVELKKNDTELDPRDLRKITEFWNPKLSLRNMRERFGHGAWLWIVKSEGQVAAWGWSLRGRTIEPHYFRLGPNDVHLFDFLVFPEFRGRAINPMLVNHILCSLDTTRTGRVFIEAAEWNREQLASLKKTPFCRLGCARKITVLHRTIVWWAPGVTAENAELNG
jgi:hypothetical protein